MEIKIPQNIIRASLFLMATIYILAGLNHFRIPNFYLQMIPPYLPQPLFLIYLSGVIEIVFGVLLFFKKTRRLAAIGIILMLMAFMPAHLYMYQLGGAQFNVSDFILLIRIPFQFVLMAWAYVYTKPDLSLS